MDIKTIEEILTDNIEKYDQALAGIKQCVAAYERRCNALIELVAESSSLEEANKYFDELFKIQIRLSGLIFYRNIPIDQKLVTLTKEFDRLDTQILREYWFKRFRAGERWPE